MTTTSALSPLLQHALRLHEDGDLDAAAALYVGFLDENPAHVGALRLLGMLRVQQESFLVGEGLLRQAVALAPVEGECWTALGDALQLQRQLGEAVVVYEQALAAGDRRAVVWNNLGLAHQGRAAYDEAARCYQEALAADPEYLEGLYNLGLLQHELGDLPGAIACYEQALRIDPAEVDVLNNLGNALLVSGRPHEAVAMYQRALRMAPPEETSTLERNLALALEAGGDPWQAAQVLQRQDADPDVWVSTGLSMQRRGDVEGAIGAYRRALALQADHPTARHLLDALTGVLPDVAPPEYVQALFDDYAPRFEGHLVGQLAYQIPALMRWMLDNLLGDDAPPRFAAHLDLGCGTGLVGAELRERVDRMVGVDLSAEMLARCRLRPGIYDALHQSELVAWLAGTDETFDLMTAADVVIYIGDLGPLVRAAAARLRPGGRLLLSTERLEDGVGDYLLRPTGRFAHSRDYLRRLAAESGLEVEQLGSTEIRRTQLGWEEGDVVLLRAPQP